MATSIRKPDFKALVRNMVLCEDRTLAPIYEDLWAAYFRKASATPAPQGSCGPHQAQLGISSKQRDAGAAFARGLIRIAVELEEWFLMQRVGAEESDAALVGSLRKVVARAFKEHLGNAAHPIAYIFMRTMAIQHSQHHEGAASVVVKRQLTTYPRPRPSRLSEIVQAYRDLQKNNRGLSKIKKLEMTIPHLLIHMDGYQQRYVDDPQRTIFVESEKFLRAVAAIKRYIGRAKGYLNSDLVRKVGRNFDEMEGDTALERFCRGLEVLGY